MYYIYCYINKINQHKYVGQTNNIERRQREHSSTAFNSNSADYNLLFHKKIREYGLNNFDFNILEIIDTDQIEIVNQKEQEWIRKENSYVRYGRGYNLTQGGDGIKRERKIHLKEALEIIELLKTEINYTEICKRYNLLNSYISMINQGFYFHMDNENYPIRKNYKTNEDYNDLIELLKYSNLSLKAISDKLNIGYSTIKKINQGTLRKGLSNNYPIRDKTIYLMKAERVIELLEIGKTDSEIIEETGVSKETIRRINIGESHFNKNFIYPIR